jgi:hypothetical protein
VHERRQEGGHTGGGVRAGAWAEQLLAVSVTDVVLTCIPDRLILEIKERALDLGGIIAPSGTPVARCGE